MKKLQKSDIDQWERHWLTVRTYRKDVYTFREYIADRINALMAEAAAQPERTPLPTVDDDFQTCENCRYWHTDFEQCRRNPIPYSCRGEHWCGEWKPCGKGGA